MADVIGNAGDAVEGVVERNSRRQWHCPGYLWSVRAFSYPDYLLYWLGMVVSFTGSWAQGLALSWLVLDLTKAPAYADHQGFYLGLVAACSTIPFLGLALPAGVIADRFSKRKITLITQSLAMLQAGMLGALVYIQIIEVWHVLVLAVFGGIVAAIDVPARHSMVGELVDKKDLVNAVALGSLAFNGARIIGPAIGGVLLHKYGPAMCFGVNTASFIAAIAALLFIRPIPPAPRLSDSRMLPEMFEGFRYVLSNTLVRDLLLMTVIICVFGTQYATVMPLWVQRVLNEDAKVLGLMMSCTGVGAVLGAVAVASLGHRFRAGRIVLFGTVMFSLSLIVFSVSGTKFTSALVMGFVGFGMMLFLSVSNSLIQMASPDELRGRVLSIRTLLFMGVAPPVGGLLLGYLTDHAGVRWAVLLSGIVCLLTGLAFLVTSKAVRRAG